MGVQGTPKGAKEDLGFPRLSFFPSGGVNEAMELTGEGFVIRLNAGLFIRAFEAPD
jgi:hypothetical protein